MVYILESDYMISYEAAKDSRCYFTQNFNLFKTIQNNLNPCMFYIEQCIFFLSQKHVLNIWPLTQEEKSVKHSCFSLSTGDAF